MESADVNRRWIIRVDGKEYGPVDLGTLREWKGEQRLLATNEARPEDDGNWSTAANIPGLFQAEVPAAQTREQTKHASPGKIFGPTFRIYVRGFFQFLGLSALIAGPSLCGQLVDAWTERLPGNESSLISIASGAFVFCMMVLVLVLWPIYLAGIQILTEELAAGRRIGLSRVLNHAVKYWPRVTTLCLIVYGVFFLLIVFALAIALMAMTAAPSLLSIFIVLVLLSVQVWLFGRWFVNVLFWQQAAVLDNVEVPEALRQSKALARSRHELPWWERPLWRGVFIASVWFAFVTAIEVWISWPTLRHSFQLLMTTPDPQTLLDALKADSTSHGLDWPRLLLGLAQSILRPLLGIAFILLYLDLRKGVKLNE